jgi:hypothetical protein
MMSQFGLSKKHFSFFFHETCNRKFKTWTLFYFLSNTRNWDYNGINLWLWWYTKVGISKLFWISFLEGLRMSSFWIILDIRIFLRFLKWCKENFFNEQICFSDSSQKLSKHFFCKQWQISKNTSFVDACWIMIIFKMLIKLKNANKHYSHSNNTQQSPW